MLKITLLASLMALSSFTYSMEKEQPLRPTGLTIPSSSQEWQDIQRLISLLAQSITIPSTQEQPASQERAYNRVTPEAESQGVDMQPSFEEGTSRSLGNEVSCYLPLSAPLEQGNTGGPLLPRNGYVIPSVLSSRESTRYPLIDTEPYSTNYQREEQPSVSENSLGNNNSTLRTPMIGHSLPWLGSPLPERYGQMSGTYQYFNGITGRIKKGDKIRSFFSPILFDDHSTFPAPDATTSAETDHRKQSKARKALVLQRLLQQLEEREEKKRQKKIQEILELNCKAIPFGITPAPASLLSLLIIKLTQIGELDKLKSLPQELLQDTIIAFKEILGNKRTYDHIKAIDRYQLSIPLTEALIIATPVSARQTCINQIIKRAAYNADIPLLSFLKEKGIDLSSIYSHKLGNSLLHIACTSPSNNALEAITFLLSQKIDINSKAKDRAIPLHRAVDAHKTSIVEYLLTNKANVHAQDSEGKTALHIAVSKGYKEIVESLIAHGADVNAQDNNNNTSLHTIIQVNYLSSEHVAIIQCLLDHKADITIKNKYSHTPLTLAYVNIGGWHASHSTLAGIITLLEEHAKQLQQKASQDQEKLIEQFLNAAETGNIEALKRLHDKVPVNSKGKQGNTALMLAARAGRTGVILYLLGQKADTLLTNVFNKTATDLAHQAGQHHIAYIIENNASLNTVYGS